MSDLKKMRELNNKLDNFLAEIKREKALQEDKAVLANMLGEQLIESVTPILQTVEDTNKNTLEAVNKFSAEVNKMTEAISKIQINVPEIKSPQINIPDIKVETPKIPPISIPKSDVVVDTTNIEKTLQKGLQSLKPPIVNVPQAKVNLKVPDFPKEMDIRGWVGLQGVDLANPLPVQLRTPDGKPMEIGGSSSSGGKIGYKRVELDDGLGNTIGVDKATRSIQTIDYAHHEIHEGDHYFVKGWMDLTNAQVFDFLATTPDTLKWAHMLVEFSAEAESHITIYEGTTTSADGTAVTAVNRDRNSSNTAGLVVTHTPTITGVGTQIASYKMGSSQKTGGTVRANAELILKQNTKYLIRITNDTALNNWFDYLADWYEHTNK